MMTIEMIVDDYIKQGYTKDEIINFLEALPEKEDKGLAYLNSLNWEEVVDKPMDLTEEEFLQYKQQVWDALHKNNKSKAHLENLKRMNANKVAKRRNKKKLSKKFNKK